MENAIIFFNDTATTEIYTLSLHDALPIYRRRAARHRARPQPDVAEVPRLPHAGAGVARGAWQGRPDPLRLTRDRKSTRLNSSHANISYAVFCLKKKISTQ